MGDDRAVPGGHERHHRGETVTVGADALRDGLARLLARWRETATVTDSFHATMGTGWHVCAEELENLLKAAPPVVCACCGQELTP